MWNRMSDFYTSARWREFRMSVIESRRNKEDGLVYSDHSKKPIEDENDIIAHHKKPLTLQNVNDFSVSLNPENIMLVTPQEHNEIHARFGYCTERKVYYVYGAPCSGKTSYVNRAKGNSDIVIDMDNIWECLTGGDRYEKPNALKNNVFAVRGCLLDMIKTRYPRNGGWERAWIIEGGARKVERESRISSLGAEPIFIKATKEECLKRLDKDKARKKHKDAWVGYIEKWFEEYQE